MQYAKQEVIDRLRRAGFREVADQAMLELPDPIDEQPLEDWAMQRGITRDSLVSAMGGSP
ncbi:MAG: hypothetical protein WA359_05295 [Acidimicrobiales bacterium]